MFWLSKNHIHIQARGGDPPPLTVSLTVKYLFFFAPSQNGIYDNLWHIYFWGNIWICWKQILVKNVVGGGAQLEQSVWLTFFYNLFYRRCLLKLELNYSTLVCISLLWHISHSLHAWIKGGDPELIFGAAAATSRKNLVSCVNFSEHNADCTTSTHTVYFLCNFLQCVILRSLLQICCWLNL